MARKAREKSSTGIYHILLRANDKLFVSDNDREYFISLIKQYFNDGVSTYGYRIEKERVHIVLKEHTKTISAALKSFCTSYARYFNRTNGIDGKLFDGRFKSEPIENDKTLSEVIGYLYRDNPTAFKKDDIIRHDEIKHIKPAKKCLAMDEYTSMTDKELKDVILFLCGEIPETLSDKEKLDAVAKADVSARLKPALIKRALDIKTVSAPKKQTKKTEQKKVQAPKTKTEPTPKNDVKEEIKKPAKKELPIWLL